MTNQKVCKDLGRILFAIDTMASRGNAAYKTNSAGQVITLNAIAGLCELGEQIYKAESEEKTKEEVKDELMP